MTPTHTIPGFKLEFALKEFVKIFPEEPMKKPTLYHVTRVATLLWNLDYNEDIQIAGLLHDALEDTEMTRDFIEKNFGKSVLDIVEANTKNENLPKIEALEDIVKRCSETGLDAMIVKVADIYDNFCFYTKMKNYPEIERCQILMNFVVKYKNPEWQTKIFEKIDEVLDFQIPSEEQ